MNWWGDINYLLEYAGKRYSEPSIRWNKRRFELRCAEIDSYETITSICMDKPTTDPVEIMEDYLITLYYYQGKLKHRPLRFEEYLYKINCIEDLLNQMFERRNKWT